MPQLDGTAADKVKNAESSSGLMDEGWHEMILVAVHDKDKSGNALSGEKGPYWRWELQVPEDAEKFRNWRQWRNVSLSDEAAGMMKDMFAAFGADPSVNTDELLGQRCRVQVGVRTIQQGANVGDKTNFIKKVEPLTDAAPGVGKATSATKPNADNF